MTTTRTMIGRFPRFPGGRLLPAWVALLVLGGGCSALLSTGKSGKNAKPPPAMVAAYASAEVAVDGVLVARYNYGFHLPGRGAEYSTVPRLPIADFHLTNHYARITFEDE